MSTTPQFHGSDLEEIEKYYHIPKEEVICFGANVNPLGLSKQVKQTLADHLDIITTYPDRNYTSLKAAIAKYCQVDASHVVVGNGSTELISLLIRHRHPQNALLLGPTYSEYERELALCGGRMQYYNLTAKTGFRLDLDDFCRHLTQKTDLLILCNPNNPTSTALSVAELDVILKTCKKSDIFVMIDETYIEFAENMENFSAMPLVCRYENLMVLRGVSKFFAAPGLRLGYGVTSNADFLHILRENQNPWSLNSIGAFAGERMLQDSEYIKETRELICRERARMYEALKNIPALHVFKPIANFILVQILADGVTSFDLFEALIRQKLMVRDCSSFQSLNGEFIRFCIMKPEENTKLLDAIHSFFI